MDMFGIRTRRAGAGIACATALLGLVGGVPPGVAQEREALRERIRERLAERRRADEAPAAIAASPGQRIDRPGDYRFEIRHGGMDRAYRVHVPAGYDGTRPTPVLFGFHGGGGSMDIQADDKTYHLISKSDRAGYIAVFPNGYSPLPSGKLATWNAGNCCAGAVRKDVDDVGFVREIFRRLQSQLNVDADRVYATGISNGAQLSYRLACEAADIFRAIAPVAGSEGVPGCRPSRPVGVIAFHARDDDFMPFEGGVGPHSRTRTPFLSVEETIARWVRRNACAPRPRRVVDVAGGRCDEYAGCDAGTRVRLCVTDGGGHSWPGGLKARTGEPGSTAFSATEMMWDFFSGR